MINKNDILKYKSKRGGRLIIQNNFIYNFECFINENCRWRCQIRTCRGKLITDSKFSILGSIEHNHSADLVRVIRIKAHAILRDRSLSTSKTPDEIVSKIKAEIPENHIKLMNNPKSFIDCVTKIRKKETGRFLTVNADIPEFLRITLRKELFIIYDSGVDESGRFLIFMSEFQRAYLKKSHTGYLIVYLSPVIRVL
ncbi:hypothetical protein DMUE_4593 [Dictyocoela muelleri]|nr:hypothetical protein DMUE_4593 [Dictyocoela muelleri]